MEPFFCQDDVFVAGADGVHTYRIPSLLVAPGGAVLAFCEARKDSIKDASPTDMVLKRSEDGGRSWGPLQLLVRGQGDEAIMNPCPVVCGDTVLLICINAHKTEHGRHRHLLLRSVDGGRTWSDPVDIAAATAAYDDRFVPGPGVSIRTRGGSLVVPGYTMCFDNEGTRTGQQSRVMHSTDDGQSWRLGQPVAYASSNESQVVELADGSLMLNWRDHAGRGCRGTAVSWDGGETWSEPVQAQALNERPCQAGFIRYSLADETDGRNRLLFSNPDTSEPSSPEIARRKMTVRLSYDEGSTWPVSRLIHEGPSCYSCPAVLPDGTIGLLYECGTEHRRERITLARFNLEWLTKGEDTTDM